MNFDLVVYITGTPWVELQLHNSQFILVYFTFNHLCSTLGTYPRELCGYAPANLPVT